MFHTWASSVLPYLETVSLLAVAYAALHDVAARTVPNWLPLLLLLLGIVARSIDRHLIAAVEVAAIVFAIAAVCWRCGWIGGGDVKLLGATAVAVPPASVPTLILVMGATGGVLSLFYLAAQRLVPAPSAIRPNSFIARAWRAETWRIRRGGPLPYACAIAAGGIFVLL